MNKEFIARIFNMKDITEAFKKVRTDQKDKDRKYWENKIDDIVEDLNREHALTIQDLMSTVSLLEDESKDNKRKKKALEKAKFIVRKDGKDNLLISTKIFNKVEDLGQAITKLVIEMKEVKNEAELHKICVDKKYSSKLVKENKKEKAITK